MRIALIAPPWVTVPPPAYGGIEAVVDCLARGLHAAGHDVLLCTTGDTEATVPTTSVLDRAAGLESFSPATEILHVTAAYDAVASYDVVHDHTLVGPLYSRWVAGPPVVTTNHGPFEGELGPLYAAVGDDVDIVAISHDQASRARPGTRVAAVIHHGLDVDAYPFVGTVGDYALTLGRMSPTKGIHVAARVARELGMPLVIAAKCNDPEEHAYFHEHVEPLLGGPVEYVGEVGGPRKAELLAGARCLLNPIAWPEPFGMVMIEALACGTPVVATPCGAAPELIEHGRTGFLAPTESDLVDALLKASDLDRAACRQAAEERFSTERMVADHLALYEAAAARDPVRG